MVWARGETGIGEDGGIHYGPAMSRFYSLAFDPLLRPLRRQVLLVFCELGIGNVLDIASGTGAQCRVLGEGGIQATGVDLSEAMVELASRRGGRNVRYIQGTAYELPFEDRAFDAALLSLALHEHTEDERALMLNEALRVIGRDGQLVVADYSVPPVRRLHLLWHGIGFVEHVAGSAHREGFQDFVRRGGVEGLLVRRGLPVRAMRRALWRTVDVAVVPVVPFT
ncbi:MAG: class I SAM-dependent methyltransferase [Candidatus Bipolaricaulota bacterium]